LRVYQRGLRMFGRPRKRTWPGCRRKDLESFVEVRAWRLPATGHQIIAFLLRYLCSCEQLQVNTVAQNGQQVFVTTASTANVNWTDSNTHVDKVPLLKVVESNLFGGTIWCFLSHLNKVSNTHLMGLQLRAIRPEWKSAPKDGGIRFLQKHKAVHAASERQYTAAGGVVQVPWGGIYEWRKAEQWEWCTDRWRKRIIACFLHT